MCSAATWEIIEEAIKCSRLDKGACIPPELSLLDYFRHAVKTRGFDKTNGDLILDMAETWGNFVGEPIHKQSLRYMWLEECIEGGEWQTKSKGS